MPSLATPNVEVFQDFQLISTETVESLRPFVFGPEYKLHRYTAANEKVIAGTYREDQDTDFEWDDLNRVIGSTIDLDYTKVFIEDAMVGVYSGTGVTTASGTAHNRVNLGINLRSSVGTLAAGLNGREVKIGDYLVMTRTVSGNLVRQEAQITGFIPTTGAATVGVVAADAGNGGTQVAAEVVTILTAATNIAFVDANVTGTFDTLTSGLLTETYTITCTRASTGGDLRTARFSIVSASGTDDVPAYVPANTFAVANPLGARGLLFAITNSASADIPIGWQARVAVTAPYTAIAGTASGGTYTGTRNITYVMECVRGGTGGGLVPPQFKVSTTTGADTGSVVTSTATNVAFAVGTFGVTFTPSSSAVAAIRKGDKWTIAASPAAITAYQIVTLDTRLDTNMDNQASINVSVAIKRDSIELSRQTTGTSFSNNWDIDSTSITLQAGVLVYDNDYLAGQQAASLVGGNIIIHWRELIQTHADRIYMIDSQEDANNLFSTPIDPDNPLVYGIFKALENSNGTSVRAMAVPSNDLDGYVTVLGKAEVRVDLYSLVPLTFDREVINAVVGHVNQMSNPTRGQWRIAWVCSEVENPAPIVRFGDDGESEAMAEVTVNGSLWDVELTAGSLADGVTFHDVAVGDKLRINFDVDGNDALTYEEITVVAKQSDSMIQIGVAPDPFLSGTDVKIEVWRVLNAEGIADQISLRAGSFANRRVYNVFPDKISAAGKVVDGYFLAASLAGLRGGVVPHQGLTNVSLNGYDNADEVTNKFNRSQMERMAGSGVWLVTQDLNDGFVYSHMELSTDGTDLNTREQMVTTNVDSISFLFKRRLRKYIGRSNVTPSLIEVIKTDIKATVDYLKTNTFVERLGGQLIDAQVQSIGPSPAAKDRLLIVLRITIPYPLNYIELHLVI